MGRFPGKRDQFFRGLQAWRRPIFGGLGKIFAKFLQIFCEKIFAGENFSALARVARAAWPGAPNGAPGMDLGPGPGQAPPGAWPGRGLGGLAGV